MTLARVSQFLRSLLPADLFQLYFLGSLVCLTIAPHLRWWPTFLSPDAYEAFSAVPAAANVWIPIVTLVSHLFYLAATAGYVLCLWPTRRGTLWVGLLVVLPVALAIGAVFFADARLAAPYESVLGSHLVNGVGSGWRPSRFWQIGTGLHCAALGLVLAVGYMLGIIRRRTQLPLRMAETVEEEAANDASWVGCKRLTYVVVAAARSVAVAVPVSVVAKLASSLPVWNRYPSLTTSSLQMFRWALEIGIFVLAMGQEKKRYFLSLLRFRAPRVLLVGIALPIFVTLLLLLAAY